MTRRRRKRSRARAVLDSEFAKPLGALVLLGLLWLAFKIGLIALVAEAVMSPLVPEGPLTVEAMEAKRAAREQGD